MSKNIIITHDGRFHADEVLACVLLKKLNPRAVIIRTRDTDTIQHYIDSSQIIAIVDVFGQYIHDLAYYDHHQRGFNTCINGVKCSSAGLVFKHYNLELLDFFEIESTNKPRIIKEIYTKYFRSVDAIDNGIDITSIVEIQTERNSLEYDLGLCESTKSTDYNTIHMRTISSIVADCENFEEAFYFVNKDFTNFIESIRKWSNKYETVKNLLENIESNNKDIIKAEYKKEILLTEKMDNIGSHICEIEKDLGLDIKFIIDKQYDTYKAYAVPKTNKGFGTKRPFFEKWRGLRDKELSKVSGIDGCVFVHSSGFLAINETLEGALEMCYQSI